MCDCWVKIWFGIEKGACINLTLTVKSFKKWLKTKLWIHWPNKCRKHLSLFFYCTCAKLLHIQASVTFLCLLLKQQQTQKKLQEQHNTLHLHASLLRPVDIAATTQYKLMDLMSQLFLHIYLQLMFPCWLLMCFTGAEASHLPRLALFNSITILFIILWVLCPLCV